MVLEVVEIFAEIGRRLVVESLAVRCGARGRVLEEVKL